MILHHFDFSGLICNDPGDRRDERLLFGTLGGKAYAAPKADLNAQSNCCGECNHERDDHDDHYVLLPA